MSNIDKKTENRIRRHNRIRAKVKGDANRPRLSVFRSNASIYLQLIDDLTGRTLASARLEELKAAGKMKPVEAATELGKLIASKAFAQNIKLAVFDRGGNRYHGRIKAIADGARAGGLEF